MDSVTSQAKNMAGELRERFSQRNVGDTERMLSLAAGGALVIAGLATGKKSGIGMAILGAGLALRGATGYCSLYDAVGINTAGPHTAGASVNSHEGIKVEKNITINAPAEELYRFWHNFENLPKFMNHLESVTMIDDRRSHWVAKGPAGHNVEWDAEVINERGGELIAWRSLEGSEVQNAGSVRFEQSPTGQGTLVRVSLLYRPPAGKLGAAIARVFGESPEAQVEEDLQHFKGIMESTSGISSKSDQHDGNSNI